MNMHTEMDHFESEKEQTKVK